MYEKTGIFYNCVVTPRRLTPRTIVTTPPWRKSGLVRIFMQRLTVSVSY